MFQRTEGLAWRRVNSKQAYTSRDTLPNLSDHAAGVGPIATYEVSGRSARRPMAADGGRHRMAVDLCRNDDPSADDSAGGPYRSYEIVLSVWWSGAVGE